MAQFDPSQFGATPVTMPAFNASQFGATPVSQTPAQPVMNPDGTINIPGANGGTQASAQPTQPAQPVMNADGTINIPQSLQTSSQNQPPDGGFLNLKNVALGADKQIASLPFTIAGAGKGIASAVGDAAGMIPGVGGAIKKFLQPSTQVTIPQALQLQGGGQQIGSTAAQIAEFFLPGGAEKSAGQGADALINSLDFSKIADTLGEKAPDIIKGILKVGSQAAISAASMAGVEGAQGGTGTQVAQAGAVGGIAGGLGKALEEFGSPIMKALNKSDFKLSPMQEAKATQKVDAAAQFETDNKILGSNATKYTKLKSLTDDLETTLQNSLPENGGIPTKDIVSSLNSRIEGLRSSDPAIYKAARTDANDAVGLLQEQGGDKGVISYQDALSGKRSYGQQAFKASKFATKDPKVTAEGAYAVEQAYQSSIESNMERISGSVDVPKNLQSYFGGQSKVDLPTFNKVYSNAITARNLNFTAQFKNDSGLMGRLFGLWAGEALGQAVSPGLAGKIIGGAAGEIGSQALPGAIRNISERALSTSGSTLEGAAKVGFPLLNPQNQGQ